MTHVAGTQAPATAKAPPAEFFALSGRGHESVYRWDKDDESQVAGARATFESYRGRGYTMYHLGEGDTRGRRMESFDPAARGILAVPQMRGG